MKREITKLRMQYLALFLILLLVEVCIALFVHDRIIRPYIGDILVVVLIYFAARIIIPARARWLPAGVFLFAAGIEILQYFEIVKLLGLEDNRFLRTIIGTTFDWKDIGCYAVGGIICGLVQHVRRLR